MFKNKTLCQETFSLRNAIQIMSLPQGINPLYFYIVHNRQQSSVQKMSRQKVINFAPNTHSDSEETYLSERGLHLDF